MIASNVVEDATNFRPQVVEAVSHRLGEPLIGQTQRQYKGHGDNCRVVIAVSKAYANTHNTHYWFAFNDIDAEYLGAVTDGYAAFGCGSADHIIMLPFQTLQPLLQKMELTTSSVHPYRHVVIYFIRGQWQVGQPTIGNLHDVTEYLLPIG